MILSHIHSPEKQHYLNPPPAGSNSFVFKLEKESITSAGVFSEEKRLVKTLWSGKKYDAGTYTEKWDGTDDEGNLAPGGNYTINVLSNNMMYEWQGVVGNTSEHSTGPTIYNNFSPGNGMVIAGNTAFLACGYNEQKSSQQKFLLSNPQQKFDVVPNQTGQASYFVATDGNVVYWAGSDVSQQWFVFGTKVSDDSFIVFPKGESVKAKYGRTYNAINKTEGNNAAISGIAVQKKGKYLFISHKSLDQLHVLDKTTGVLLHKISTSLPSLLTVDKNDDLWLCYQNNRVEKFSIAENGTITSQNIKTENLPDVLAMAASPESNQLLICTGGNRQQVIAVDTNTAKQIWTFGQKGGYAVSAEVTNDKFYFSDLRKSSGKCFVCIEKDHSFWIGDAGNYRMQHYNADKTFIERVMYIPAFYSSAADGNDATRVFANYLEFAIDYSKPLASNNGSWTLVKNWGSAVTKEMDGNYMRMKCVTTLKNNRTYALFLQPKAKMFTVVELGKNGKLRQTNINLPVTAQLYPDGSLRSVSESKTGSQMKFSIQALLGFNKEGNPMWKQPETIAVSPANSPQQPLFKGNLPSLKSGEITDSGVLVSFDASKKNDAWHLGGIKKGDNKWLWRTAQSTTKDYKGSFPPNGFFDIGNGVRNAGSIAIVFDNHIFWGYHGEFWKASQTNKWNHVHDNGLFVNQFGTTGPEWPKHTYPPGMAGNVLSASVIKAPNGKVYLYHNDENMHGGIHRWQLSGFETLHEQIIPLSLAHSEQGLLGVYFNNAELNNFGIVSSVQDSSINFSGLPRGSARWTGFIKTKMAGNYTFFVAGSGKIRLWIQDNLVIDKWNNETENTFTCNQKLETAVLQVIKIESADAGNLVLSWSINQQPKEIIAKQNLIPASNPYSLDIYNLLDGFSVTGETIVENNLYGWSRSPAKEDHTNQYNQWWSARTVPKLNRQLKSPDLKIKFSNRNQNAVISRTISLQHSVDSWQLTGALNFTGNQPNRGDNDGFYFDLLDKKGNIITRMYFLSQYPEALLYVNKTVVAKDNFKTHLSAFNKSLSIAIQVKQGNISFSIGNFPTAKVSVFAAGADWRNPAELRIQFMAAGNSTSRLIGIESLIFSVT